MWGVERRTWCWWWEVVAGSSEGEGGYGGDVGLVGTEEEDEEEEAEGEGDGVGRVEFEGGETAAMAQKGQVGSWVGGGLVGICCLSLSLRYCVEW